VAALGGAACVVGGGFWGGGVRAVAGPSFVAPVVARSWPNANTCGWRFGGRRLGLASAPAVTVGCGRRRASWAPPRCPRQGAREEKKGCVGLAVSSPRQCFKTYAALLGAVCCILLAARAAAGGGATHGRRHHSHHIISI